MSRSRRLAPCKYRLLIIYGIECDTGANPVIATMKKTNRDMKFLAFYPKTNTMYDVVRLLCGDTKGIIAIRNNEPQTVIELFEGDYFLRQYTGLNDKYGKEIYEGSIVLHPKFGFCPVVFCNGCFGIDIKSQDTWQAGFQAFSSITADVDHLELVGDIYLHPELLDNV